MGRPTTALQGAVWQSHTQTLTQAWGAPIPLSWPKLLPTRWCCHGNRPVRSLARRGGSEGAQGDCSPRERRGAALRRRGTTTAPPHPTGLGVKGTAQGH